MTIETINPTTEEIIQSYPLFEEKKVDALIDAGNICYQHWKKTSFSQRKQRMLALAQLLKEKKATFAELIATEMGKPVQFGAGEIEKCVWVCKHYAENAEAYLESRLIETEMQKTKLCYRPIGVIFAIMPWNFPFWQVFRFAAPNIMAGNAAILKHASISTGTGNAIAKLFLEAGFPEHLFQHFILDNDGAAKVIQHPKIAAVTLTGSVKAGKEVGAKAVGNLKKIVLELGGSDPYVVLRDADLDLAAKTIIESRFNNSGQVCISAKRVIAAKEIIDELQEKIVALAKHYEMSDPLDPNAKFGPLARKDIRDEVHRQVKESIEKGAKNILGGQIPLRKGFYYPPTVLIDVKPGMPAFDEEIFGPVVALIAAEDESHAVKLANDSEFGLGAAVFTQDIEHGEKMATEEIEAGSCFVNSLVSSDPRVPFGGIKHSGFGRELSREGILEFVNAKTVSIR